ncbi:MAG: AMP-binding protein, partial [Cyanobacteriota bacterium]
IDSQLVQRWEEKLRELPEVEQVAVVIQEQVESLPPLHLSDLLPDWKTASVSEVNQPIATPITRTGVPQQSETKRLAISHGEPLRLPEGSPTTLSHTLQRAALESPNKGIVYIQSDGSEVVQSYPALLKEAQRILAGLRKLGLKPQDKVIFQFDQNQDFIAAFWGCILGGFIPVPIAIAPSYCESNSTINKLYHAWHILERPIVLTSQKLAAAIFSLSSFLGLEEFRVETVEALRSSEPESNWHTSRPEDLALIMLTSGSTGMPKGVMLTEHNLLNRSLGSIQMNGFTNQEITLNWMSLDHVAGLIYSHIRDVYLCCQQIHAPTEVVLKESLKWLDLIERFRVTVSFAPNFAYGLVNDQAEMISKRQWDLSSIQFFLNGAEAIHAKTARRFLQLLAPHKLSTTVMHPAWGMAETSSGITYSNNFSLDSTTDDDLFVEVGEPIPGISLRIVDDNNQVVEEKTAGRLQVKGLSVTSGYYQNPELNQEVFTDDGWFNTGDLGFLHQGRLTLTGRSKDIIIINGLNYYSHEIEAVVEEVKGVEVSYTAACAVRIMGSNSDLLAIFFHTSLSDSNRLTSLLKDIRASVVRKIGVNPTYLIPVEKEAIPKTEIGKIQRSQLSQRFIAGEFDSTLKQLDIAAGNANTLPDWFYRPFWRPKVAASLATQPITGSYLVFLDRLKL